MKICVLAGGESAERTVSLESGETVTDALTKRGHEVLLLDPVLTPVTEIPRHIEVVVPLLHGAGGEDGVLQRQLDQLKIPYTGSSAEASELTFDKARTNQVLRDHGLPVPPGLLIRSANDQSASRFLCTGNAFVVKPVCQGSSIGVSIVRAEADLRPAISKALKYDSSCLVEEYIPGREMTVAVLNRSPMPSIEIRPRTVPESSDLTWFDYQAKYLDDETEYIFDESAAGSQLGELAVSACETCGVRGMARVDFKVDPDGNLESILPI